MIDLCVTWNLTWLTDLTDKHTHTHSTHTQHTHTDKHFQSIDTIVNWWRPTKQHTISDLYCSTFLCFITPATDWLHSIAPPCTNDDKLMTWLLLFALLTDFWTFLFHGRASELPDIDDTPDDEKRDLTLTNKTLTHPQKCTHSAILFTALSLSDTIWHSSVFITFDNLFVQLSVSNRFLALHLLFFLDIVHCATK